MNLPIRALSASACAATSDRLILECRSWDDFWRTLSGSEDRSKQGDAFERLTQLYLQTQPEYRSKLRHVWRWFEVPDTIRAQLKLPVLDEGIDLLAETVEGEFWAIQSKFRSRATSTLTRTALSTFTSLASVKGISQQVVAHTSSQPIRKHDLMGNLIELGLERWAALDEESWSLIQAQLQGRPVRPERRLPRPHQQPAIEAALHHFDNQGATRGRLIMPCGTGKSLTAFFIAEALDARNILVAVPSLALIRQSLSDWTREYVARTETPEWLCVCSDDTVGELERDSFVAHTYDLGIPTTTSQEEIIAFLAKPLSGRRITFTTYQSSGRLAEAARQAGAVFDLAILDEAHRTVGVATKTFATLLRDDAVNARRRLFMTATERVLRGANDDVLSMDDEDVYGDCFFQLSFKDAIAQGIISDYRILTIMVSDERIREIVQQNRLIDLGPDDLEGAEAQAIAAGIALRRVFQEHDTKHAISFHRSIRAADRFREQQDRLNGLSDLGAATTNLHISSSQSAGQRSELLREFVRHERALMTNARCLTEGVDIPAIDCVLFADPKRSIIDIVQAAGRALRRSPGKEYGYILLPLIVPEGVDVDAFAETTAFRQVARTITALSTQDERIAEEFRAVEQGRKLTGKIIEIEGDVPAGLQLPLDEFAAAIQATIWQRVGRANWRTFEGARAFVQTLGLRSLLDWQEYSKTAARPCDIPTAPDRVYAVQGWQGYGDWLGTGKLGIGRYQWRSFEEARAFARKLGLKNQSDWFKYSQSTGRPSDIPASPGPIYASEGWQGFGDWLGTGQIKPGQRQWRSFEEARAFVRTLHLGSYLHWMEYSRSSERPLDIPAQPDKVYASKGWQGYNDWIGNGRIANQKRQFLPFEEARAFVRSLGLKSMSDWKAYCQSAEYSLQIPTNPNAVYASKGWQGYGDWIGSGRIATQKRQFLPFEEARAFVRSLGLKSQTDWVSYCKSAAYSPVIPTNPNKIYASEGWQGYGDWLGTGRLGPRQRQWRSFEEARAFVRLLGLKSQADWKAYYKSAERPPDIPSAPHEVYASSGWQGLGDWLGTGLIANHDRECRPFEEARAYVRGLGLRSAAEWPTWSKSDARPADIPVAPSDVYADQGWQDWSDWLGKRREAERDDPDPK